MCVLDRYFCEKCDISWQSIHNNGVTTAQICNNCEEMVTKDEGTQVRVSFSRIFKISKYGLNFDICSYFTVRNTLLV
jgi:hypothetical protein